MAAIASVLFAAGRGKRLRPLTDHVPKPCLPMLDVPLLAFGLTSLTGAAEPVVVNASHLADAIRACVEEMDGPRRDVEIVVERPHGYGTGGTLAALRDRIADRVVTWNGDLVSDVQVADVLATHRESGCPITIAARRVSSDADFEEDGRRAGTMHDRRDRRGRSGIQFIGVAVFERETLSELPDAKPIGLGETLLRSFSERRLVAVHLHDGYAADVGTIGRFVDTSLDLLHERGIVLPTRSKGTVVEVPGGLAYLGPGAIVDRPSLGPGAVVLRDATVDAGSRIEDSIVWPGEHVPSRATIRRAVWAFGRAFEPEANQRAR